MPESVSPPGAVPPPSRAWLFAFLGVTLLGAGWLLTRSWHASILDRSEFRQLQTALAVYWMNVDGFRLDYEFPIFGPPWSVPFEFPIYQWCVVAASRVFDADLESAARGVSVAFLGATLPAIYGIAGQLAIPPTRRLLVVSAVLAGPTYLFYGRAFMIETTALCFSAWFLYTLVQAVRDDSTLWALGAAVGAILAGLTKVTTLAVFLPPAAILVWRPWRQHWDRRREAPAALRRSTLLAAGPVLAGIGAAGWWVRHGDQVKSANSFAGFLTSSQLSNWVWGTAADRFSGGFWAELGRNLTGLIIGGSSLVLLAFCAALVTPACRRAAAGCAGCFLAGPLLFSNLYFRHDYYYCANAIFLLAGAGILLAGVWDNPRLPRGARLLAVTLFLGGQFLLFHDSYGDYHRRVLPVPPGIAGVIRETVPAGDVVLLYGWDWNTLVPYYAQRRVVSVPSGRELDAQALEGIVAQLGPRRIAALLIHRDINEDREPVFLRERLSRFNFNPVPFASSADGDLYLPKNVVPAAQIRLASRTFAGVTLNGPSPAELEAAPMLEADAAALAVPLLSPHPTRARGRYGVTLGLSDGHLSVLAHPVSELQFTAPKGALRIEAVVGLVAAAYAPDGAAVTDGISVEIYEQQPMGIRRVLYQRDLDPVRHPDDRGPQSIHLEHAGPFSGPVIFRITAGPRGNYTNDWAYWGRISIH